MWGWRWKAEDVGGDQTEITVKKNLDGLKRPCEPSAWPKSYTVRVFHGFLWMGQDPTVLCSEETDKSWKAGGTWARGAGRQSRSALKKTCGGGQWAVGRGQWAGGRGQESEVRGQGQEVEEGSYSLW